MPEEMRWRRPGRVSGMVVVRGTAVVVAACVSSGRERFGVAVVVPSMAVVVWACGSGGRRDVVVAPYIVVDAVVRSNEVVGFVDVTALFAPFAAVWCKAWSWLCLFADAISVDNSRSRLLKRSVSVLMKELHCWERVSGLSLLLWR